MGGARALIASLGASISLVAGAALSLLVVSFVFAYDGLLGEVEDGRAQAALRVKVQAPQATRPPAATARTAPVVVRVQAPTPQPTTVVSRRSQVRESGGEQVRRPDQGVTGAGSLRTKAEEPVGPDPEQRDRESGDAVRDLGDGVGATVQGTATSAGQAAAPLGPPVTQAVQQVLDLVVALLQGATGALGDTLGGLPPKP